MRLLRSFRSYRLPRLATAPFCPSEVRASVRTGVGARWWTRFRAVAGTGLLVAVGYMDPGNWATDIEAGSRFGYGLLWVVACASLIGMLLQDICVRVGVASGRDLAQLCRQQHGRGTTIALWLLAEVAIIACDIAEVIGTALALTLLSGLSLETGVLLTALDTVVVLALQGAGFRRLEAIIGGLIVIVGICCGIDLALARPDWAGVAGGLVPDPRLLSDGRALYLALGILGATVMPHNLYLHSSIVGTRNLGADPAARRDALRLSGLDSVLSLGGAFLVNAGLLVLAAAAFHAHGHTGVTEIQDAHHLLAPVVGSEAAATLFAIALLACGQSSTITGTIAGQVILEGFLALRLPCWIRRLITRGLAIIPAFIAVHASGAESIGTVLVGTQVVLSLQLPFAVFPLLRFAGNRGIMDGFVLPSWQRWCAWTALALIVAANGWMVRGLIAGE
jgi:manganese transport protein